MCWGRLLVWRAGQPRSLSCWSCGIPPCWMSIVFKYRMVWRERVLRQGNPSCNTRILSPMKAYLDNLRCSSFGSLPSCGIGSSCRTVELNVRQQRFGGNVVASGHLVIIPLNLSWVRLVRLGIGISVKVELEKLCQSKCSETRFSIFSKESLTLLNSSTPLSKSSIMPNSRAPQLLLHLIQTFCAMYFNVSMFLQLSILNGPSIKWAKK